MKAIPINQWTHKGDEVLILRFCQKDGSSRNGFKYPLKVGEKATCPDWKPAPVCGNGLHGWPWGLYMGEGKDPEFGPEWEWQVYGSKPENVVECDNDGKVKFKEGILRFTGKWECASNFVLEGQMAWVYHWTKAKSEENTKDAVPGSEPGKIASGLNSASAATGYKSASAATGKCTASVCTGRSSKAKAGEYGCIALCWFNEAADRDEMRIAEIGVGDGSDGKLKADTWYQLDETGKFTEAN